MRDNLIGRLPGPGMRLADLMGARVLEPTGTETGQVGDVRLVEHPAPGDATGRRYCTSRAWSWPPGAAPSWSPTITAPSTALARLARKAARRACWTPWGHVASHHLPERLGDPATIHLRCPLTELPLLTDVHHQWAP
jgi:hypothetical protein